MSLNRKNNATSLVVSDDRSSTGQGQVFETNIPSARDLHRTFTSRHIQMICLGGCVGSGLFISTGKVDLHYGGAPAIIIGYSLICLMALSVMNVLTENTCLFPTTGSFIDHASRFVDPALGFAIGFCEWAAWVGTMAAEAAIVRVVLTYWTDAIPTAACMTVYLAICFGIHALPNRVFGEFEFGTAALKVITMVIVLIVCIVMLAGGGSTGSTDHGVNWTELPLFPNGFKGVCQTFALAAWATGGQEIMGISVGEASRPRWDMPRACTNLFIRIVFFYVLSVIFIGLLVPYNNDQLLASSTAASSPFTIAMKNSGIKGLPDLLNAVILLSLVTVGVEGMYISSRVAVAMSKLGLIHEIFGRVDSKGRPRWAIAVTGVFSIICTYINCSSTGAVIFTWFSSFSATVYFVCWMLISLSNWQMHRAIRLQSDQAWKMPFAFRVPVYPSVSVFLFVTSFFVLFGTGYVSLYPIGGKVSVYSFFETFLGVPIFIAAFIGYKLVYRTKFVNPAEADLQTNRRELTEDDIQFFEEYYAQSMWKRILSYVVF